MSSNFWNEPGFPCGCGRGALPGASGASGPGLGTLCTNRFSGRGGVLGWDHLLSLGRAIMTAAICRTIMQGLPERRRRPVDLLLRCYIDHMAGLAEMNWIRSLYSGDTNLIACCPSRISIVRSANSKGNPLQKQRRRHRPQLDLPPSRSKHRLSNLPDNRALCQPYSGEQQA